MKAPQTVHLRGWQGGDRCAWPERMSVRRFDRGGRRQTSATIVEAAARERGDAGIDINPETSDPYSFAATLLTGRLAASDNSIAGKSNE